MDMTFPPPRHIVLNGNLCWDFWNYRPGIVRALLAAGYRITVLAPLDDTRPRVEAMGAAVYGIDFDRGSMNPVADLRLIQLYRQALSRLRPDMVINFGIKPVIYGGLAARWCGIPAAAVVTGLGSAFIRGGWLSRLASGLYRVGLDSAKGVFFLNPYDRDFFLHKGVVAEGKTQVLPGEGVDVSHFAHRPLSALSPDVRRFLFVGRLLRDKGIFEYVRAAGHVRRQYPDVRFQVLGSLDPHNPSSITEQELSAWIAAGDIDYLGRIEDVRPSIEAAHCVVLPSYREGLPRALLEAAAVGRPLLASDVPGCRDIIMEGENGWFCRPGDVAHLAQRLVDVIETDPSVLAAMGRRARELVCENFADQVVARHYLDFLAAQLPHAVNT
ncbi:MAG TPA: glycosyltransferase family 4 protein [Rhodocyclaceae bacterium]|nr:glycosyltransferase family 4 protein [Rhodocyclaceae bacterium]